ncbi:TetR family transcriptional regulator [Pseudooceanicola sp. CBS1P-1]|uniref:TetR family transcriptional regulator n=1 Tax=Pseudooceanicola albus TaxID=2692189 RepID=A0A6L7G760_9RHOB|nr:MULTISPECIES: TetR/AcrR family transcriptional regulator [Pseudooceanicola]MBT9386207.1 TetR family transcriptional regulator [Pseudooceanicola endophyticus]MXN19378.1 TetR family transcriptional regulator [Pseudooceanicola albus]
MTEEAPTRGRSGRRKLKADQDTAALAEATRADIIAVATRAFVRYGFDGASVNEIAAASATSKRMIYYHFGSKQDLYRAVLEAAYERVGHRAPSEAPACPPLEELRAYAVDAYDNFRRNEDFVRLVMAENLKDGETILGSDFVRQRSAANLASLEEIVARGRADGSIRVGFRVVDLYLAVVAVCFHAVSNRISTGISLQMDLGSDSEVAFRRQLVGDVACRYAATPGT